MFVSCTVFVLSGRGLCDGTIPRPEESYRLWCMFECDQVKIKTLYTYCVQVGVEGRTTIFPAPFVIFNFSPHRRPIAMHADLRQACEF
jgi:hypothetical protein